MSNPKSLVLVLGTFLVLVAPATADQLTRKQIYQQTLHATAWIVVPEGYGTGWVVDRASRLLITNYHVVNTHDSVYVVFPAFKDGSLITERSYYKESGTPARGRVVETDADHDLALVQLNSLPKEVTALTLAAESPSPGDNLHSIGNPGSGEALWEYTSGTVRQVYHKEWMYADNKQHVNARVIQTQEPINPGDSGGPVVNDDGELVGVNAAYMKGADLMSICIDVSEVKQFMEGARPLLNTSSGTDYLNRGIHYQGKGRYDRAIADFIEALRLNPKNAAALNRLGLAYAAKGVYDQAIAHFTEALRLDDKNGEAYRNRGDAYEGKGDHAQAIADYTQSLRLNPKDAVACRQRGLAHANRGEYDEAMNDFTEAIRLDPGDAVTYRNRGISHTKKGDWDKAVSDYSEALRINPKDSVTCFVRALAYGSKGARDQALEDYNQALQLNPQYAVAYNNRGLIYQQKGDFDKAIADYTEALRFQKLPESFNNRGEAYREKGRYDEAIADLTEAIRVAPNYVPAHMNRGLTYLQKKQYDKAIADYTGAIQLDPQNSALYRLRGFAYFQNDQNDQAITDCTVALRLNPKDAQAYRSRGSSYGVKGENDQAIADLDEAIRLAPKDAEAFRVRGALHQLKGEYDKEISDLMQAVQLNPQDTVSLNGLAWVLSTCPKADIRDGKKAVDYATKACELSGWKTSAFLDTLGAAYAESGQFDKAIQQAEKALEVALEKQKGEIQAHLELFRAGKPYRATTPEGGS